MPGTESQASKGRKWIGLRGKMWAKLRSALIKASRAFDVGGSVRGT